MSLANWVFEVEQLLMPWCGALTGFCAVGAVSTFLREAYWRSEVLTYASLIGIAGLACWCFDTDADDVDGALWFVAFGLGFALVFGWQRYCLPWFDRLLAKLTLRSDLAKVGRTDIRNIQDALPASQKAYDPSKYYRHGTEDGFFMGLDGNRKPIYWPGRLPHVAVVGSTGSGKGCKLQCLSVQSIAKGECLFYLDPKDDEYGPHVIYSACTDLGKPYHYLRLLPNSAPQINLIADAEEWQIVELLISGLDLGDKGQQADYYMAKNRDAARAAAQLAIEKNLTLAQVYVQMSSDENWAEEASGFIDRMKDLANIAAINARHPAYSLKSMVETGGAVYVCGSMTLTDVLRAQQSIFVRIQQLATERDRLEGPLKTVCVVADEMRFHISKPVIHGLAACRDKGMRVVLAFQAFSDLKDCPASMNPDMVIGSVIENTPVKLAYRIEDPDTAEWLQRKSGKILVDDESKTFRRNAALAEIGEGERTIRESEHFLFDSNKFTNLFPGLGVLFGLGIAQFCFVSPILVTKCRAAISPDPVQENLSLSADSIPPQGWTPALPKQDKKTSDEFFSLEAPCA